MKTVYAMTLVAAALGAGPLWAAQDGSVGREGERKALDKLLENGSPAPQDDKLQEAKGRDTAAQKAGRQAKPTPTQLQKMVVTLNEEVKKCWIIPVAVREQMNRPVVTIRLALDRNGNISGAPQAMSSEGPEEFQQVFAESAIKALRLCQPYSIAKQFPQFYDLWKEIRIRFDPREL